MVAIPRTLLASWAADRPTIKAVYVFGSYARGEATSGSDLDLAFEFMDSDDGLSELITNARAWKAELSRLTGIIVKDLCLSIDKPAQGIRLKVFSRD